MLAAVVVVLITVSWVKIGFIINMYSTDIRCVGLQWCHFHWFQWNGQATAHQQVSIGENMFKCEWISIRRKKNRSVHGILSTDGLKSTRGLIYFLFLSSFFNTKSTY